MIYFKGESKYKIFTVVHQIHLLRPIYIYIYFYNKNVIFALF